MAGDLDRRSRSWVAEAAATGSGNIGPSVGAVVLTWRFEHFAVDAAAEEPAAADPPAATGFDCPLFE